MIAVNPLELLAKSASSDGGFGYRADQPGHLEPTALALLALAALPDYRVPFDAALKCLQAHAHSDGSYRLNRGRPQAVWPTALALFVRGALNHPAAEIQPIANKLLQIEGKVVRLDTASDAGDIDAGLLGWPWAEETFSWVEPTAWACLALRSVGLAQQPRVQEGLRLLLDRAFDEGGANYGSRVILGKQTEPIPGPTAILLLALQGVDDPRVEAAKGYLRIVAEQTTDVENLAWIALALGCQANDSATADSLSKIEARLIEALRFEMKQTDGLGAGPMRLALASLALNLTNRNPFKLNDTPIIAPGAIVGGTREAAKDEPVKATSEATGFLGKLKAKMQNFLLRGTGAMRPLPATSAVHIAKAESYEGQLVEILQKQFEHFREFVPIQGKRVVLKPNLVEFHRDRVINTDPRFVGEVIELFQKLGASEVIVAEGPGHWRNVQFLVNSSGLGDVLRKYGVRFVDINHDEPVKVSNVGRTTGLEHLYLSKTVLEADVFVSLPKLKTHHWAGVTLSLKNLFGTLPGICYGWPKNELHWRGIPNSIVDIALTQTPHLAIIDGIVGMEGDGPLAGNARQVGAIVMGIDLLAVDATGSRLMGIDPERLPTLKLAEQKRLGRVKESEITQLGESIASLMQNFELPPEIEKQLIPG